MVTLFNTYSQDTVFKPPYHHIIIHEMILDKLLTAKLSRMAHLYRANVPSVNTLEEKRTDATVCKKKKTIKAGCIWMQIITAVGSQ